MESYGTIRSRFLRNKALEILGGKCCKCPFNDPRALQIDHIDGCGKENRIQGHIQRLTHIINNPHLYQILCANCNWIKKHENKEIGKRWGDGYVPKKLIDSNHQYKMRQKVPSESDGHTETKRPTVIIRGVLEPDIP